MFDKITSVLPPHSSGFEKALEQASLWVIENSEIVDIWNPDTAPARFLPWLAWSVSVDEWDSEWSDQKKRSVVRNSVAVHRLKGTKGAVRRALEAMGFSVAITEWFENNEPVHTFQIDAYADDLTAKGFGIDQTFYEAVARQIDHVKPARSHYDLRVGKNFSAPAFVRTGSRYHSVHSEWMEMQPPTYRHSSNISVRNVSRNLTVQETVHNVQ